MSRILLTNVVKTEQEQGVISTDDLDFVDRFFVSDENVAAVNEALPLKQ